MSGANWQEIAEQRGMVLEQIQRVCAESHFGQTSAYVALSRISGMTFRGLMLSPEVRPIPHVTFADIAEFCSLPLGQQVVLAKRHGLFVDGDQRDDNEIPRATRWLEHAARHQRLRAVMDDVAAPRAIRVG